MADPFSGNYCCETECGQKSSAQMRGPAPPAPKVDNITRSVTKAAEQPPNQQRHDGGRVWATPDGRIYVVIHIMAGRLDWPGATADTLPTVRRLAYQFMRREGAMFHSIVSVQTPGCASEVNGQQKRTPAEAGAKGPQVV
jgi:hypothetical protein